MSDEVAGFSTMDVCRIVGVPLSTLNAWARGPEPLVTPSLVESAGKRATRYWSVSDLVIVRTIKALRQAGCPLQQVRTASALVSEAWEQNLAQTIVYWDGADVVAIDSSGDVHSLVRQPGQAMLHLVAMHLGEWRRDAESQAQPIPLAEIRARRAASRSSRPVREATVRLATEN